jgi:hypothetical protein
MRGDEDGQDMKALVVVNAAGAEYEDVDETEDAAEFADVQDFDDLLRAARSLEKGDGQGVVDILCDAAALGRDLTDLEIDLLLRALHDSTGAGMTALKKQWKWSLQEEAKLQQAAHAAASAAADAEAARRAQEARERIWASCGGLATSPKVLDELVATAKKLGLVGEEAGAKGVYLTCTSRLLASSSVRLLRLGSSASGKNFVVETVLRFIPGKAIVQISGASPKALPYFGGDDNRNALKGMVLYVPEATILEGRDGAENEFTKMFKTLISEGRIFYQTVYIDKTGRRETRDIVKDGPIAAILTCARDVDYEMRTRSLIQETDESAAQTEAIVKRRLSKPEPEPDLAPWLDLQQWLELEAPYRVDIPFSEAVKRAYDDWQKGFFKNAPIRLRRDINSFLAAVEASAVLHRAQRATENGAIVATLEDYKHAYEAFSEGLATVHGKADAKLIATVEAIEAIEAAQKSNGNASSIIKVTVRALAKMLRIGSPTTAKARLAAAETYGAIEQVDGLPGRGAPCYYELKMASIEIRAEPEVGAFPPPHIVLKFILGVGGQIGRTN